MDTYEQAIQELGRDDVTATFGLETDEALQVKPDGVYYGVAYGYDESDEVFRTDLTIPLVHMQFNKYRPDLPPWHAVMEFVLAAPNGSQTAAYTFPDVGCRGTITTGDLKTVTLHSDKPLKGADGMIANREQLSEYSGDTNSFKVTDTLE